MANNGTNTKNAAQMRDFLQKGKGGSNKAYAPVTSPQVKKLNSHRKMGK